jgi:hypothetical protein
MRATEGSFPKIKHAPVSVRTNAPECPLNVYQELEAMATGASLPDVTLTDFRDVLTTTRSESLPEPAASLHKTVLACRAELSVSREALFP